MQRWARSFSQAWHGVLRLQLLQSCHCWARSYSKPPGTAAYAFDACWLGASARQPVSTRVVSPRPMSSNACSARLLGLLLIH